MVYMCSPQLMYAAKYNAKTFGFHKLKWPFRIVPKSMQSLTSNRAVETPFGQGGTEILKSYYNENGDLIVVIDEVCKKSQWFPSCILRNLWRGFHLYF